MYNTALSWRILSHLISTHLILSYLIPYYLANAYTRIDVYFAWSAVQGVNHVQLIMFMFNSSNQSCSTLTSHHIELLIFNRLRKMDQNRIARATGAVVVTRTDEIQVRTSVTAQWPLSLSSFLTCIKRPAPRSAALHWLLYFRHSSEEFSVIWYGMLLRHMTWYHQTLKLTYNRFNGYRNLTLEQGAAYLKSEKSVTSKFVFFITFF